MYGWKARVGLIIPSTNTVNESEFARYLPDGVSLHTSRMLLEGGADAESLAEMEEYEEQCARLLGTAEVNAVAYGCTTGSLIEGPEYDHELEEHLSDIAGAPVVATSAALKRAAEALGLDSLSIATPYVDQLNEMEEEHFEELGFDVTAVEGLGIGEPTNLGRQHPTDAYEIARRADRPDADGLMISCTDFRTLEVIEDLEADLGKPVISSNSATMWNVLREVGVDHTELPFGTLFEGNA
jgi:maleate isomerase